jgi:mono/diheme cytochrome c family protein
MIRLLSKGEFVMLMQLFWGCTVQNPTPNTEDSRFITKTPQRSGSAELGLEYLLYGNYIGSGIPRAVYDDFFGPTTYNPLERTGPSASIPYLFNLFSAPNGIEVVGGINCFGCHTSTLNGEFHIGLGNAFSDYTQDESGAYVLLNNQIANEYGTDSLEWEAYRNLGESSVQIGSNIVTPFAGVNPAFALEEAAVQYRDPQTLVRGEEPLFELGAGIPSDTPPWWNIQKKHALYYNGVGRGDMAKLIMQICVVGVWDDTHAADIEMHFPDVLAFLYSIEPPPFPNALDDTLLEEGKQIFNTQCAGCHGTYGEIETYPNLLIPLEEVGTDPKLAQSYIRSPGFIEWLQESWFAQGPNSSEFVAEEGYMAPPLDGVWATAPYLHNGSVPDLETLLNSPFRPVYWRRDFSSSDYDLNTIGWPYEILDGPMDTDTYNTTRSGFGNEGHTFGDALSTEQRTILIEYLKSL